MRDSENRKYNFDRPLQKNQVNVSLILCDSRFPQLENEVALAADKYKFELVSAGDICVSNALVRHAIIVDGWDNPREVYERHREFLEYFTSATIAVSYSTRKKLESASQDIEILKKETFGLVNFLLPTITPEGTYVPRVEKLVDNSICDSVRVKYRPQMASSDVILLPDDVSNFFSKMSLLIEKMDLYHRANTDGFIAYRRKSGGFYVTCTKTEKVKLNLERVSIVHEYNESENEIHYSGKYMPSSDSVECATVFQNCTDINAILHVHASKQITRNPKFSNLIAIPPMRYGEAYLGDAIVQAQSKPEFRSFMIMEDHGELFFSRCDDPDTCAKDIEECIIYNVE